VTVTNKLPPRGIILNTSIVAESIRSAASIVYLANHELIVQIENDPDFALYSGSHSGATL
jgi:hypothetical protein